MTRRSDSRPFGIRIIGGTWRGRRLPPPESRDVRPTPDRVRETVFNWLAPTIQGSRCLDLFAGTGALGIEALSRGAAECWFVEQDRETARHIEQSLTALDSTGDRVVIESALRFLGGQPRPFDIVFVDPPYDGHDLGNLCKLLDVGWVSPGARVYLEMRRQTDIPQVPERWTVLREKLAGQVRYALAAVA